VTDSPVWPWARVLAHRGGGTLAPENTIAAIEVGRAHGFRAVEFDTRLARDGVPVVIHDATLERTTNGRGPVAARTAAELARLDAGGWYAPRFAGTPVPTLAQAIAHCRAHCIWPNVEIKRVRGDEARVGEVVARALARLYGDVRRPDGDRAASVEPRAPLLSSFSRAALAGARRAAPDLPRGLLVDSVPVDWREEMAALGCVSLHADHETLTPAQARAVKDAGYWLFCYTVDDPARAREILDWGVDAFCTDRIDVIGPHFA
jgi:glycerophosphoryl diester phosphodiesterase